MSKDKLNKNKINEGVDELTSDFKTFDEFKKGVKPAIGRFVYSQVGREAIPNIKKNGADGAKEFFRVMCYGRGLYSVLTLNQARSYSRGGALVVYAVKKGAYDNMLIFDMGIRKELYKSGMLTRHERISQTIKRLFSKDDYKMLENYYGYDLVNLDEQVMKCDHSSESEWLQERFLSFARQGEGNIQLYPGMNYNSEKRLDVSGVTGWAYHSGYGDTLIFRTVDVLTPYKYAISEGGRWNSDFPATEDDPRWKYCIDNENDFDNINVSTDAFFRARKDYPDTRFTEKTVCGFSLVKNGKKYNLLNARTGKYLSPVPFDYCEAFDPHSNTAAFSINSSDGTIEFLIKSENRGERVSLKYRLQDQSGTDESSGWSDISYEDFLSVMEAYKQEQEQEGLNESIDEVFTNKDRKGFMGDVHGGKYVFIYSAAFKDKVKSLMKNGLSPEFLGTNPRDTSIYYGIGGYACYSLEGARGNLGTYGDTIIKYALKGGFKNFLIFDGKARAKYDPGSTVYDEIVRLVPKKYIDVLDKYIRRDYALGDYYRNKGIHYYDTTPSAPHSSGPLAKVFYEALKGGEKGKINYATYYAEQAIAESKVRGYMFNGNINHDTIVVRDYNSLIPVGFSTDGGRTWHDNTELDDETFDKLNKNVYPYYQYRGEYEDVGITDHPSCGFSLVKGKKGYNYMDIYTHHHLLPIDVDSAEAFDPRSHTAQFTFCGIVFQIRAEGMNCQVSYQGEDGYFEPTDYNEFMQLINAAKEQGLIPKEKQVYTNCLINPSTPKNFQK